MPILQRERRTLGGGLKGGGVDDAIFGATLRSLRTERGLTQTELGEQVGTTGKRISYYECNYREPCLSTIRQLAAALGCTAAALLAERTGDRER